MRIRNQWDAARAICVVVMVWGVTYGLLTLAQLYLALRPLWTHS